jgi:hypothetical protein
MGKSDTWKLKDQIKKHDVKKQKQKNGLALNAFDRLEGMFFYGNDGTSQLEFATDLDLGQYNAGTIENPRIEIEAVGMQMLCPRCSAPLYIKGKTSKNMDGGKEIVIHWDRLMRAESDGLLRPLVSVDGVIGCDYYDTEWTGNSSVKGANIIMRCGWKGGIINGHCFDHVVNQSLGDRKESSQTHEDVESLLKAFNESDLLLKNSVVNQEQDSKATQEGIDSKISDASVGNDTTSTTNVVSKENTPQ